MNRLSFLQATIHSVRASVVDEPFEIIVVDGGSSDGTVEWLVQQKDIITILQHNREVDRRQGATQAQLGLLHEPGLQMRRRPLHLPDQR